MNDCLFCKFISGEIKPDIVYEDEHVLAFRDIAPQAPTHILIIPKKHITSIAELQQEDTQLVGYLFEVAKKIAQTEQLKNGYRLVINVGEEGGQTVPHIHLHLMGGRSFGWPAG